MEGSGLSKRGAANVSIIWPKISKAVAEREEKAKTEGNALIDLSTSENWLIRNELIEFYKNAIERNLAPRVCDAFLRPVVRTLLTDDAKALFLS